MNFEISEKPGADWDLFVEKHTNILFYYSAWSEVLKKGLGGRPCYMYLRNSEGILCGMPAVILKYYGIKLLYSSIPYGGYVGDSSLFPVFIDRFVKEARAADIVYILPSLPDMDKYYTCHFRATAEAATRIDLKGRQWDDIRSCFNPSVRQSINKGARLGLEALRCHDKESFLTAYQLYLQTMRRNRAIARYSESWFSALHHVLAGEGRAIVYLVRHNGISVSATVVINSEKGYHLLHSGSSTEHLRLRANDLVVCEIVRDGLREGKEYIDFMLSDPVDAELIRWKEKFGGSTVLSNKYSRINRPFKYALWNGAKRVYPFLQSFKRDMGTE